MRGIYSEGVMMGNNIVIVGAGEVGRSIARTLSTSPSDEYNVYIVEQDAGKAARIKDELDAEIICGNGARPNVLAKAGVIAGGNIDTLIACTDRDEVNMLSCWIAKSAGVRKVISRTRSLEFTDRSDWGRKLGINAMISPERSISREITSLIRVKGAVKAAELLGGRGMMYSMRLGSKSPLIGMTLKDMRLKFPDLPAVFVYVEHEDGLSGVPDGSTVLRENDICYAVTYSTGTERLQELLQPGTVADVSKGRKVFIVGGGKLGTQIALMIKREFGNVGLRILDKDVVRCGRLSEEFGEALVLNADGADKRVLTEEGIEGCSAYICATNSDELNMIYCVMAKELGAEKTIAVVKRSDYQSIAGTMGISSAVNTNTSLANVMLQYLLYEDHALAYMMVDKIKAEMLEVKLPPEADVTGRTLADIRLGKGAVVALIGRGEEVLLPAGNTMLRENDHVILFALSEMMPRTAKLFGAEYHGH